MSNIEHEKASIWNIRSLFLWFYLHIVSNRITATSLIFCDNFPYDLLL